MKISYKDNGHGGAINLGEFKSLSCKKDVARIGGIDKKLRELLARLIDAENPHGLRLVMHNHARRKGAYFYYDDPNPISNGKVRPLESFPLDDAEGITYFAIHGRRAAKNSAA